MGGRKCGSASYTAWAIWQVQLSFDLNTAFVRQTSRSQAPGRPIDWTNLNRPSEDFVMSLKSKQASNNTGPARKPIKSDTFEEAIARALGHSRSESLSIYVSMLRWTGVNGHILRKVLRTHSTRNEPTGAQPSPAANHGDETEGK